MFEFATWNSKFKSPYFTSSTSFPNTTEFWISEFISNSEKNRVQNQLDFFSSSNLIFTACVACKNQFRNQIDF